MEPSADLRASRFVASERVCVMMKWSSFVSTTARERVVVPWSFSTWEWQHSSGLVTVMQKRICRHAWPDVTVLSGDEKSLAAAVLSVRSSHPYVQWVVIFAGHSMSGKGSLEPCDEKTTGMRMSRQLLSISVWLSCLTNGLVSRCMFVGRLRWFFSPCE